MKVGLVRHFAISAPTRKPFMNSREFADWVSQYEVSGIKTINEITSLSDWPNCYCSSSVRTMVLKVINFFAPNMVSCMFMNGNKPPVFCSVLGREGMGHTGALVKEHWSTRVYRIF